MSQRSSIQRFYTINLNAPEDWLKLISGLKAEFPQTPGCKFTLNTSQGPILFKSTSEETFCEQLEQRSGHITHIRIEIEPETDPAEVQIQKPLARIDYRKHATEHRPKGLYLFTRGISRYSLYKFEQTYLHNKGATRRRPSVTFGSPCEVMAAMIDLRGFAAFCERPEIESPYTCAVVTAYYQTAEHCFESFPPDVLKVQGDGILMIWKTCAEDRSLVADIIREGVTRLDKRWSALIKDPQFYHGAPTELGTGVSFGLASSLPDQTDFLGRPINMAARISDHCKGGEILLDANLPGTHKIARIEESVIDIKGIGKRTVWRIPINDPSVGESPESSAALKNYRLKFPRFSKSTSKMAPR